jgi:hypothetical protein
MNDEKNGVWMIFLCFMESSHGVSTSRGSKMYTNYTSTSLNSLNHPVQRPWTPVAMYYAKGTLNAIYNTPLS